MALEGMQSVQARISEIQGRIGTGAPATAKGSPGVRFADVLSAVSGTTAASPGSTATATATVRAPGEYGLLEPPAELAAYGNGRVPLSQLVTIGVGSERLCAPAADAFRRVASARGGPAST